MRKHLSLLAALALVAVVGFSSKAYAATDNLTLTISVNIADTTDIVWAPGTSPAPTPDNNGTVALSPATPGFGDTYATNLTGASAGATLLAANLLIDNVGNRRVDLTIVLTDVDSQAGNAAWEYNGATSDVGEIGLQVKAADSGAGSAHPQAAIPGGDQVQTAYAPFAAEGGSLALVNDFRRYHNYVALNVEYAVPTDYTDAAEFGVNHVTTLTITGTSN